MSLWAAGAPAGERDAVAISPSAALTHRERGSPLIRDAAVYEFMVRNTTARIVTGTMSRRPAFHGWATTVAMPMLKAVYPTASPRSLGSTRHPCDRASKTRKP